MATTPGQIDLWRQARSETQRLEFKEAKNQYDFTKTCKYCVALANEGGGQLLLGVADLPPRPVVGSQAFPDTIKAAQDIFQRVGFRVDVEEVSHPAGRVVVFSIPSRPRGTAYHLDGAYLMRSGQELVPMSEDRLRAIFSEGKPDWLEEPSLADVSGQRVVDLLDTQTYFELVGLPSPTTQAAVLDRLVGERLIDRTPAGFAVRRMAAVLLARQMKDFPDVARKSARVIVYSGWNKLRTKLDETWQRGYAVGFRPLVSFVMAQLPQSEVVVSGLRRRVSLVPEDAIRELVANSLVHQDFAITGASAVVEVYSDRVEVSNPGEPVVPVARFIDGYQSRNERLADLMRRMHICEEKSSGIDIVVSAAESASLPPPDFTTDHRRTCAVVFGHKSFDQLDRDERLRACYQHCSLRWVNRRHMTNKSLRERFRLPASKSASVSQVIATAIEAGLIRADEEVGASRRFARYLPWWA